MPSVDPPRVVNISDLRRIAKRRLPRAVFDYIDGGADAEVTLRENSRAFDIPTFRPRCAVETPKVDLSTTVLGTPIAMPVLLGPVGSCRLFSPRGEEVAAHAAGEAGTIYTLSTLSGCCLEDVKNASRGPCWYQVYLCGGRDVATSTIERARAAGFSALVVTIDTPVAGFRERDVRNGIKELLTRNPVKAFPFVWQYASKPWWVIGFLRDGGLMKFPNVVLPNSGPMLYADVGAALEESMVTWADLRWIREVWDGPIIVKGVHIGDDARKAIDAGASAVVVSNHGGRQLDGVKSTLQTLPEIVAAVNGQVEVLLDGGIRRGSDIAKAICLGAQAVLIGRAYAYGLGAAGGAGVARAIEILRTDYRRTLKLLGCSSTSQLNRSYIDVPSDWLVEARQPARAV
jgi:L-lactate dehydrogenase (cytochrome)